MEIRRSALLERSIRAFPRLLQIVAPPGYGKSVFARQLSEGLKSCVTCDCAGTRNVSDLARRLVAALAEARPAEADDLARAQLSLSQDPADWTTLALRAWSTNGRPDGFLLENAEALTHGSSFIEFYARLVATSPRLLIVCSREPLPIPYGHGFSPVDVLVLGQQDLRFSSDEIAALLPSLDPQETDAVELLTAGWPVVVALLGRRAERESLSTVLDSLRDVVHGQLYEYLASQLVAALLPSELDLAIALASVPAARRVDLERALGRAVDDDLHRLRERLPMSVNGDRYVLHPMLAEMLRKEHRARSEALVRTSAEAAAYRGEQVRAAQLYLAIGDQYAAARVLQHVGPYLMSTPSLELTTILGALDGHILSEHPALWAAAMMYRGYSVPPYDWLRIAHLLWDRLPPDADPHVRISVFSSLLNACTNLGLCTRARALLDEFVTGMSTAEDAAWPMVFLFNAALDSFDGKYDRIPGLTKQLMPVLAASDVTHALYLNEVISPMHRSRGEWQRDVETLQRALELSRSVAMPIAQLVIAECVFSAWFRGDDRGFEGFVEELEAALTPGVIRGQRFFLMCVRGRRRGASYGYEKVLARAQALLIASGLASDADEARSLAAEAVRVADESSRRYLRILARTALAELDPSSREQHLDEAIGIAEGLQSEPMRLALEALRAGRDDVGMLTPFITRFRRFRASAIPIALHALEGRVLAGNAPAKLGPSELAVLLALAHERRWHDVAQLSDTLFSELDADTGGNRVYVYVHRVRRRLGAQAIVGGVDGYRLGPGVWVDLWEADALLSEVRRRKENVLDEAQRERLARCRSLSRAELSALAARCRLPDTIERRLVETRQHLLAVNATDALERGDLSTAMALAEQMLCDDGCDEQAERLLIRAHLLRGEREAAQLAWRRYRATLRAELGADPPPFAEFAGSVLEGR